MNLPALLARLSSAWRTRVASARIVPRSAGHSTHDAVPVPRSERPDRRHHVLDEGRDRERLEVQLHLARLDLRQVQDVVDQGEQVLARPENPLVRLDLVLLAERPRVLEEHLGDADDGVHRRPQLVAHVGEELRLVLAGDLELRGPCPRSRGRAARSGSRAPTASRRSAGDRSRLAENSPGAFRLTTRPPRMSILAKQRDGQQGAVAQARAGSSGAGSDRRRPPRCQGSGRARGSWRATDGAFPLPKRHRPEPPRETPRAKFVGRPQMELLGRLVVLVDRPRVGSRELDRP